MAMVERVTNLSGGRPELTAAPLAAWIRTRLAAHRARLSARRTERRLLKLSDRMLEDIGVSRAALESRHPRLPSSRPDAPRP